MFRRRRADIDPLADIDPAGVSSRFAPAVADALAARRRYADVLAGVPDGPVREQLVAAGTRLDAGVRGVWDSAVRATHVERTVAALEPERVIAEYKRAKRSGDDQALETALAQRFASVQRLLNALDETDQQLRLLDARLTSAVAGAAEVALGVGGDQGATTLDAELDGVVTQLGALRLALDELR